MKIILVPTDFSDNADNALKYATTLAKKKKAKLILLNAFHIAYPSSTFPAQFIEKELEIEQHMVNHHLQLRCAAIHKAASIKCEYLSILGTTTDVILKAIKQLKPDLVVMGTKGESGLRGVFIGSNTAKIIGKAKCPIIAIPELSTYHDFKNIIYATDFHTSDISSLKRLIELAKPFKADVNIIHIYDGEFQESQRKLLQKFQKKVERAIEYKNISFNLVFVKNTGKELKRIVENKSNDLLVMSTHHRNLLDNLMNRSITKKIASHSKIPILALQHKEEPLIII